MTALRAHMADLFRWSEGDGELIERLRPGAGACEIDGTRVFGDGFSIADAAGGSYHVAAATSAGVTYLVTSRTWFSGYDAWEAAGMPSDPGLTPRHGGQFLSCLGEREWGPCQRSFAAAVKALHQALSDDRPDARREAAFLAVEQAMGDIEKLDLARSGVPAWLLGDTPDGGDEPVPSFGP